MNTIAFYIQGNSMNPTIANGDMVICKQQAQLESVEENEVYAIVTHTGAVLVKRVKKVINPNGRIVQLKLISDNPAEKPLRLGINNIKQLLKVEQTVAASA